MLNRILIRKGLLSVNNELGPLSTLTPSVCVCSLCSCTSASNNLSPRPSTLSFRRKLCYLSVSPSLPGLLSLSLPPALCQLRLSSLSCFENTLPLLLTRSPASPSLHSHPSRAAYTLSSHIPLLPHPTDTLHQTFPSWDIIDSAPMFHHICSGRLLVTPGTYVFR